MGPPGDAASIGRDKEGVNARTGADLAKARFTLEFGPLERLAQRVEWLIRPGRG